MDIFKVNVDDDEVCLFFNKKKTSFSQENASKFSNLMMRVVPGFPELNKILTDDRSPETETRVAVKLVTNIENMARCSTSGFEERKRVLGSLTFLFQSIEARATVHNQLRKMPMKSLSSNDRMNELQVATEMCDVFEFA